jgi:hypothetical protein
MNKETCKIKYFKTTKQTNRFSKNQKVWVVSEQANHLYIVFNYRGKGRYVKGVADKFAKYVGDLKEIDIQPSFAKRLGTKGWGMI